jgi:predicted DCC family thiol-disulfide oxidoreductase YuxK
MLTRFAAVLDRRVNPRPAGVVRALIGLAAFLKGLQMAPLIGRFEEPGVLRIPYLEWAPSVADLPAAVTVGAWLVFAALFGLGLFTYAAGIGLTLTLAAVLFSDQQLYSNHLYLLTLLVGLLTVARSGAAVSVDAGRGRGRESVPNWPLLLVRTQISVVYLYAGLSKISATFLSGTVVAITLRREGPLAIPDGWRTFEPMAALSLLAILAELFLAVALWLPRWRRAAFVVGLGLHVGIAIWFVPTGQLAIFSVIILAPYLLFLDVPLRGATVVWDAGCDFCRSWVGLFRRLDWLRAVRFVPSSDDAELAALGIPSEDADRALQLVRDGRRAQGYRAVVGVLEVTPVAFLWAPLLRLPPVAWAGDRLYRRTAERRRCSLPRPAAEPGDAA